MRDLPGKASAALRCVSELLNNFSARSLIIKLNGDFEGAKFRPDLEWDMVFVEEQFDTAEVRRREIWRLFEGHYRNKLIVFMGVSFRDHALRRILSVAAKAIPRSRTMAGKSASFVTPLRTLALRHTGKAHALTEAFACSKVSRVVAWLSGAQATDGEA